MNQQRNLLPVKQICVFCGVQIMLGLLISTLSIDGVAWIERILVQIEKFSPTFKTAFLQSTTPSESKIYLMLWWALIIPWGLWYAYCKSDKLKPHSNGLNASYASLMGLLIGLIIFAALIAAPFSFYDYSYYWETNKAGIPSRSDFIPSLMSQGPLILSVMAAPFSYVLVIMLFFVAYISRVILAKAIGSRK